MFFVLVASLETSVMGFWQLLTLLIILSIFIFIVVLISYWDIDGILSKKSGRVLMVIVVVVSFQSFIFLSNVSPTHAQAGGEVNSLENINLEEINKNEMVFDIIKYNKVDRISVLSQNGELIDSKSTAEGQKRVRLELGKNGLKSKLGGLGEKSYQIIVIEDGAVKETKEVEVEYSNSVNRKMTNTKEYVDEKIRITWDWLSNYTPNSKKNIEIEVDLS